MHIWPRITCRTLCAEIPSSTLFRHRPRPESKKPRNLVRNQGFINCDLERAMGIEPTALAWEARVLPLYDARSGCLYTGSLGRNEACSAAICGWALQAWGIAVVHTAIAWCRSCCGRLLELMRAGACRNLSMTD